MSAWFERPLPIQCEDRWLCGILHAVPTPARRAVLIVVGGPQYRVGSHRQFVLLARDLAASGYPVLRFDYRGMGDSDGEPRTFENIEADVRAATDALLHALPEVREVVIWGLCDAASAAAFHAHRDPRIAGLVIANPWVREPSSLAQTYLRSYYMQHVFDAGFWRRLFGGEVGVSKALASFGANLLSAIGVRHARAGLPERFLEGIRSFKGPVLLIVSGADLTAAEFLQQMQTRRAGRRFLRRPGLTRRDLEGADHTFSSRQWRDQVGAWTAEWLRTW